ncbi:hypothetical protein ACQU0X_06700 [Pseudovibrio ascidiaceicola]|uniref:hypothetical protein n=1 Tax=Pseudovibrio ascidiaceicola TaxID=285279 RepID=UPI003D36CF3B
MWIKIIGNEVSEVSYASESASDGWFEVTDQDVAPGYIRNEDGSYSLPLTLFAAHHVRDEAERLINQGTLINGVQFRCDTDSISRLEGLVRGFEREAIGPEGKTYKTSAGVDITFTTKAQVQAVLNVADDYRDWILERSAQIQNMASIPDPKDPDLWIKPTT